MVEDARNVSNVNVAEDPPPGWLPPGWSPPPPGGVPPPPVPPASDANTMNENANAVMIFGFMAGPLPYWKYTSWKFCEVPEAELAAETDGADVQPSVVHTSESDPELLLMDGTFT